MTQLYLIRHAESEINTRSQYVSGRSNEASLTPRGIIEAKLLGRHLFDRGIVPSKIYSSPARRAIQTASHALEEIKLEHALITTAYEAQEMSQGDWVGRLRQEIYTEAVLADIERLGKDFKAPGGESMNEVGARMVEWANSIATESSKRPSRIFVFTHGFAIRCFASTLHNWTQLETYDSIVDTTSVSLFNYQNGVWQMEYLGLKLK